MTAESITLSAGCETIAQVNPHGAELVSFTDSAKEYIWSADPQFWPKHSPVLFPIVGTLKDNQFEYNEKTYNLSRHGFARDRMFTIERQTIDSATFLLAADDRTIKHYPFRFELRLIYKLKAASLTIGYEIRNIGDCPMPFAIGAHPAFAVPGDLSMYQLKFENPGLRYHLLENNLIVNRTQSLHAENGIVLLSWKMFENDALIFKDIPSRSVMILKAGQPYIKVSYNDFPHLGIWTKSGAQFLCIEPWTGYSDSASATGNISEKESMILLPTGETFMTNFRIDVF